MTGLLDSLFGPPGELLAAVADRSVIAVGMGTYGSFGHEKSHPEVASCRVKVLLS